MTATAAWGLNRSWRAWELWGLGAVLAAGWMALGPLALGVPAACALALTVRDPDGRRQLGRLGAAWGVPLAAALVAPWAVAAYVATDGEFFRAAVGRHVVARSLTAFEGHGGVPGYYLVTGVVAAFPWFALLAPAIGFGIARRRADAETRFLVAWLLGPLILFELAQTKLVHYWLPAYPAGVLLVTAWLFRPGGARLPATGLGRVAEWCTVLAGLALAAAPVGAAAHFGLGDLVRPALHAALPLLATLLVFARSARSRLALGGRVLAAGAALHLAILAGAYLPRLADVVVERRAARALLAVRAPDEAVVVYRGRAADALVTLPPGSVVCGAPACVAGQVAARGTVVGLASARDLAGLRRGAPGVRVAWLAAVTGLDLVHGRWEGWIVFRAAREKEAVT
jgi:4-amino-4-deoxy-L-arabinose transferase-like glycosyltransferase